MDGVEILLERADRSAGLILFGSLDDSVFDFGGRRYIDGQLGSGEGSDGGGDHQKPLQSQSRPQSQSRSQRLGVCRSRGLSRVAPDGLDLEG